MLGEKPKCKIDRRASRQHRGVVARRSTIFKSTGTRETSGYLFINVFRGDNLTLEENVAGGGGAEECLFLANLLSVE